MRAKSKTFIRFFSFAFCLIFAACTSSNKCPPTDQQLIHPRAGVASGPPKVGVVLGAGGARTYAQVGVLQEFDAAGIPIHAIVGLEWGALVGALYAQSKAPKKSAGLLSPMMQLKEEDVRAKDWWGAGRGNSFVALESYLQNILPSRSVADLPVVFSCPSLQMASQRTEWRPQGALAPVVKKCMSFPPLLTPQGGDVASVFALDEAVEFLRDQGAEVFVFVDVLGGSFAPTSGQQANDSLVQDLIWIELKKHYEKNNVPFNEVIKVSLRDAGVTDFTQREELIQAGQKEGQAAAQKLRHKYGF